METKNSDTVIVLGRTVTLRFAATPNDEVVDSVKAILRASYFRRCPGGEDSV